MMIDRLKRFLGKDSLVNKADIEGMKMLSSEERELALFSILYELAFQNAATFAHQELQRHESPFGSLDRNLFFHELLILNFWMMGKIFSKDMADLAEKMHFHYFGTLPDIAERTAELKRTLKAYKLCWDEYSGHHDEFGLKVGERLFGKDSGHPERQVSFWIISYADASLKKFKKIRKELREADIL